MIYIFHKTLHDIPLSAILPNHSAEAPVYELKLDPVTPIPFAGVRHLWALFAKHIDRPSMASALNSRKSILSLVLKNLERELTPEENQQRSTFLSHSLGFLSHNSAISFPLITAWSEILSEVAAQLPMTIVIPNCQTLDVMSMAVFRKWIRELSSNSKTNFVLGYQPETDTSHWLWGRDPEAINRHLAMLEAMPFTSVDSTPSTNAATGSYVQSEPLSSTVWDDFSELNAYRLLARLDIPLSTGECQFILQSIRHSFSIFGFTTTLRLGLEFLNRNPQLSDPERAELHNLLALAAYNRQVRTQGNTELAEFLSHHFNASLKFETDPARRSHLFYRLCINSGRRQDDLEAALELAGQAIAEANQPLVRVNGLSGFLEAWALNGRAYVLSRLRRLNEAIADCQRAFELLNASDNLPDELSAELTWSRLVILDNFAELAWHSGDLNLVTQRQRIYEDYEQTLRQKTFQRLSPYRWLKIFRRQHLLKPALPYAHMGFEDAKKFLLPDAEDFFCRELGDFYYRLGQAEEALSYLTTSLSIRRRIGSPEDILNSEIGQAMAWLKLGRLAETNAVFIRLLQDQHCQQPSAQAEVKAMLAIVAALRNDAAACESFVNQAIGSALESGQRNAILRVAICGGEACLHLNRRHDARMAFEQALDVAKVEGETSPAGELFRVYLGILDCEDDSSEWLREALDLLPAALEDSETWWHISRLLKYINAHVDVVTSGINLGSQFKFLFKIAEQRADCQALLIPINASLEKETNNFVVSYHSHL